MAFSIRNISKTWVELRKYIPEGGEHNIVIPEGVTRICCNVFQGCADIERVVFPRSIKRIDEGAFKNCKNLKTLVFTGKPQIGEIEADAFDGCPRLTKEMQFIIFDDVLVKYIGTDENVIIPDNVKRIQDQAFSEFIRGENGNNIYKGIIKKVYFPDSVSEFGLQVFFCCVELREVRLPKNIKVIKHGTFYGCHSLKNITFPEGIEVIESAAFYECNNLKTINLPEGLREIGTTAFLGCRGLTEVILPRSLKVIGQLAFAETAIEKITSNNVEKISGNCVTREEPYYIFPRIKIEKGIRPDSRLLLSLGFCVAPELYSQNVAETYDSYICNNYEDVIKFAKKKGVPGIEEFCKSRGYSEKRKKSIKNETELALEGIDFMNREEVYLQGIDNDELPSNEAMIEFVRKNFYTYPYSGIRNAACLGETSMALAILLLDGVLKSKEFHASKGDGILGSWFSCLYESCGNCDVNYDENASFFRELIDIFIDYGIVFKFLLPDKSDTVYVIRNYEKYLKDDYKCDFPQKLRKEINDHIQDWLEQVKEWSSEY